MLLYMKSYTSCMHALTDIIIHDSCVSLYDMSLGTVCQFAEYDSVVRLCQSRIWLFLVRSINSLCCSIRHVIVRETDVREKAPCRLYSLLLNSLKIGKGMNGSYTDPIESLTFNWLQWTPISKIALIYAVRKVLPYVLEYRCRFHFGQAVRRKIQQSAL